MILVSIDFSKVETFSLIKFFDPGIVHVRDEVFGAVGFFELCLKSTELK